MFSRTLIVLYLTFFSFVFSKQWPMPSGPMGNYHFRMKPESVPISWSVRQGKNIRWETSLPQGGQSGIAVWDGHVFLTVNPALKTRPLKLIEKEYFEAKEKHSNLFIKVEDGLKKEENENYLNLISELKKKEKIYEQAKKIEENKSKKKGVTFNNTHFNRKSKESKSLKESKSSLKHYIESQDRTLKKLSKRVGALKEEYQKKGKSKDILLYCIMNPTGEVLWVRKVKGIMPAMQDYAFSDSTSPGVATDGKYVWVVNASGGMACFDINGKQKWQRTWAPTDGGLPFNKQYEVILYKDWILNVEPPQKGDQKRNPKWNYLHAFNKSTGKRVWVSDDALTHYCTPMLGKTKKGIAAVLIGRGGPHEVPERPNGLSLIDLSRDSAGQSLWQWKYTGDKERVSGGTELQLWDASRAFWVLDNGGTQTLYVIDSTSGKLISAQDMNKKIDRYEYDVKKKKHVLKKGMKYANGFSRQTHTMILKDDKLYFTIRKHPFIHCHDVKTRRNYQLEIPTEVDWEGLKQRLIYKEPQTSDLLNSKGQRHNPESRSMKGGEIKAFLGSTIAVNKFLFFTNAIGITYVIDTTKPFGPEALVSVNDLGKKGETFSLNTMACYRNKMYHRSLKAIVSIEL